MLQSAPATIRSHPLPPRSAQSRKSAHSVGVDRDDGVGTFDTHTMLDRTGNSRGDIHLRTDRFSRLADLPIGFHPAFLDEGTGTAPLAAENRRKRPHKLEILRRTQPHAAGDNDVGIRKLGLVAVAIGQEAQHLGDDVYLVQTGRVLDDAASLARLRSRASP